MKNNPYSSFIILNSSFLSYQSHRSLVCRAHQAGVCLQRLGHFAIAGDRRHGAGCQFGIGQPDVDGAVRDVYLNNVAVHQLADIATGCRFGRPMLRPDVPPLKRPSVISAHSLPK